MARPTIYSTELAEKICAKIAQAISIREICEDDDMPSEATVYLWLTQADKKEFLEKYEAAQGIKAEKLADELIAIADDGTNDYMTRTREDGEEYEVVNAEHIQRSRLRVDTRKWVASKLLPKKYGERNAIEVTGKDGKDLIPTDESRNQALAAITTFLGNGNGTGSTVSP
jgi:hypothetical protein